MTASHFVGQKLGCLRQMDTPENKSAPERIARKIVMDCADCDCCRPIMDESCLFFPELYRLYDQEAETGQKISPNELRHLLKSATSARCARAPISVRTSSGPRLSSSNEKG